MAGFPSPGTRDDCSKGTCWRHAPFPPAQGYDEYSPRVPAGASLLDTECLASALEQGSAPVSAQIDTSRISKRQIPQNPRQRHISHQYGKREVMCRQTEGHYPMPEAFNAFLKEIGRNKNGTRLRKGHPDVHKTVNNQKLHVKMLRSFSGRPDFPVRSPTRKFSFRLRVQTSEMVRNRMFPGISGCCIKKNQRGGHVHDTMSAHSGYGS